MSHLSRRMFTTGLASVGAAMMVDGEVLAADNITPDLSVVDPELRAYASGLLQQLGHMPEMTRKTLPALRSAMSGMSQPPSGAPPYQKRVIRGLPGSPDVTVFVVNAQPGRRRPAIVHMHGGGFVTGSAAGSIGMLQPIATALGCVIVSVEYRLAPETDFEGSIADNYAALKWTHDENEALGVDRRRIAVMGESAGGGHAALLAIEARDRGEVPVLFQALIYPMLDDRTGSTRQPSPSIGTILWTPAENRFGWNCFMGQVAGTPKVPTRAVPARQVNLRGLPPAFIGVGTIDLFVDEDMDYARRLIDAGTPTQLVTVPGAFHGFDGIAAETKVAKRFTDTKLDALRRAFASEDV